MPDNGGAENIGGVSVSITGDYSPLQSAFNEAQNAAQTAGKDISDALVAGAASGPNLGKEIADQLSLIDPAVSQATGSLNEFDSAASQAAAWAAILDGSINTMAADLQPVAGEASQAAAGVQGLGQEAANAAPKVDASATSMEDLVKQMLAVKSALVITKAIQDFGQSALDASDSFTKAEISLTVLTGSAAKANNEITQLVSLAEQDGLSMPNLFTAATRMQALVGAAAPVPAILAQLANAGAVSGQGIDAAANAFDRLVTSGNASARTLLPLGVTLDDLAKSFNALTGTTEATNTNVSELMKTLGEPDRILVTRDALSKLNDVARQVATETFGGQWAQLVAQWNLVLKSAGDALLPVISDLLDFTKTDIVPFIQGLANVFGELPEPIKDTTVALGLAALALVPLTAAVGSALVAFKGFTALGEVVTLLKGIQTQAVATAAAETTLAEETATVGPAAATAASGVTLLTGAYVALALASLDVFVKEGQLISAWSAGADAQNALNGQNQKLIQGLQNMGIETKGLVDDFNNAIKSGVSYGQASDQLNAKARALIATYQEQHGAEATRKADIDLTANAVRLLTQADDTNSASLKTALQAYQAVSQSLSSGVPIIKGHVTALQDQWAALEKVNSAAAGIPDALGSASLAMANNTMAAQKATLQYQAASGAYEAVLAAFNRGQATLGQVSSAFEKMQQSEAAAAAAGAPVAGSLQAIDIAANAAVNSTKLLATNQGIAADQAKAQSDNIDVLSANILVDSQRLDLLVTQESKVAGQVAATSAQYSQQLLIKKQVTDANDKLMADTFNLEDAELKSGNAAADAGGEIGLLTQKLKEQNLALEQAQIKFDAGKTSTEAYTSAKKAARDASINLAVAVAEEQANVSKGTSSLDLAAASAAGAAAKLDLLTKAFHDNNASIQEVESAQKAYIDTQVDLAKKQAVANLGLQGATDAYSLQLEAVTAAKAEVDAYTQLQRSGIDVASQLQSATDNLATAQTKLNGLTVDATKNTKSLVDQSASLYGVMGSLPDVMGNVSGGLNEIVTSAKNATTQLEGVAGAVKDIESDIASAITGKAGSTNSAGFSVGAPDGYTISSNYVGGKLNITYVATQATVDAGLAAQAAAQYKAGYTPVAIAKALGEPIATILGWLGVTADKANLTEAQVNPSGTASAAASAASNITTPVAVSSPAANTGTQANDAVTQAQSLVDKYSALLSQGADVGAQLQSAKDALAAAEWTAANIDSVGTAAPVSDTAAGISSGTSSTAVDGGVYPDVTAHQAAGEIWQVSIAGVSSTGATGSSDAGTSADATSALAASSTASTVASAAQSMAVSVGVLQQVGNQAASIAQSLATITPSKAVAGTQVTIPNSTTGTGTANTTSTTGTGGGTAVGGTPTQVGIGASGGYLPTAAQAAANAQAAMAAAAAAGVPWDGSIPWDGKVPNATPSTVPASTPGGGGQQISVQMSIDARGNANDANALAQVISTRLVSDLFSAGARMTQ